MNRRAFFKVVRNSLISELEYRTNYLILILSTFITIFMEMAIFNQIYMGRDVVQGMPRDLILPFVLVGALVRYGFQLWTLVTEFVDEIRDGTFRKYLLQPLHYPTYFYAKVVGPKITTWAMAILSLVILRHVPGFGRLLPAGAAWPFALSVALGFFVVWEIYLAFILCGFWIEEASFLNTAFNIGISLFSGAMLPMTWLPQTLQRFLAWTPFPLIGDFPIRTALGLIQPDEFRLYVTKAVLWFLAISLFNVWLRKAGVRSYEAYGG